MTENKKRTKKEIMENKKKKLKARKKQKTKGVETPLKKG